MMSPDLMIGIGLLYIAAINGITWLAFATDKAAAQQGYQRIAEQTLLMVALLGGTPAAYFARHSLRHKTRKQPFSKRLHTVTAIQIGLLIAVSAKAIGRY